jgi:pimeloyl-ACP methyl ester carboxylesterase
MSVDVLSQDLSPRDERYPATLLALTFESYGEQLLGRMFVAQGAGPHPTIVLLHGFPGNEQNGDLAHIFRRAGWNVFFFHYRGAWGSPGSFSFTHSCEDVASALRWLRTPQTQECYRVDAQKIVLIGHSMGGFAALLTAATDPAVYGVASLAGFQFGAFARLLHKDAALLTATIDDWRGELAALRGTTAEQLVQEVLAQGEDWDVERYVDILAQRRTCLIGASYDTVATVALHHAPLVAALEARSALGLYSAILPSDHAFSDVRVALAKHLLTWLASIL